MAFPDDGGAVMLLFPIFVESNKKVLLSNVFPTRRALVRKRLKSLGWEIYLRNNKK